MGEVTIANPGATRGYPYPVCTKYVHVSPQQTEFAFMICLMVSLLPKNRTNQNFLTSRKRSIVHV